MKTLLKHHNKLITRLKRLKERLSYDDDDDDDNNKRGPNFIHNLKNNLLT